MSKLKPAFHQGDHYLGDKDAPVILVEYGDFECPHCGHAHPLLQRLLKEKGKQLLFIFRHFPIQESHPHAYLAALAAEAAGKQDKFWEMHDLIFENQQRLDTHLLMDFAESLQLDLRRFGKDWESEESRDKVESDFESGVRSGVNGTPSFFVNGQQLLTYDETFESLTDAIELALEMKQL
jgi:protein-disulfide isomerase